MKSISVVIGANYGDEGKGQVTDYLAHKVIHDLDERCLVILCNGGSQRGHTVTTQSQRHIFHHFGSGTFAGADTCIVNPYIVNPIIFRQEYEELQSLDVAPKVYLDLCCRFSTPFDMMINQILESARGDDRHGSCGYGIWETICRYNSEDNVPTLWEISRQSKEFLRDYLKTVRDSYIEKRLSSEGYPGVPSNWQKVIYSETLLDNYIEDMQFLFDHCDHTSLYYLDEYKHVIFEMGQGLMLEDSYSDNVANATPSYTGLKEPMEFIRANRTFFHDCEPHAYFVTRSYLTRHGAGTFENECNRSDLDIPSMDQTNVPNDFQGVLRYAPLDGVQVDYMIERVKSELSKYVLSGESIIPHLVVTHVNEIEPEFLYDVSKRVPFNKKGAVLVSNGEIRESFKDWRG